MNISQFFKLCIVAGVVFTIFTAVTFMMSSSDSEQMKNQVKEVVNQFKVDKAEKIIYYYLFFMNYTNIFIGYDDPKENTWEPVENCDCPDLIAEFEANLKKKSKQEEKPKASRSSRANTKSVEPEAKKSDRKRKSTLETPIQPIRKKKVSPPPPPKTRLFVESSSSSSSDSDEPTTSVKKEENGEDLRPQDSSTPQPNHTKTESEVPTFTPVADLPPLDFVVKKIEGITGKPPNRHYVVVRTEDDKLETAEIKAVVKQNLDMMLDYLLARLEEKKT